jgi:hypothetical protein
MSGHFVDADIARKSRLSPERDYLCLNPFAQLKDEPAFVYERRHGLSKL